MTNADRERFGRAMLRTAAAYGETFTEERVAVYYEELERYPVEAIEAALGRCITELTFFPRIAQIIDRLTLPDVPDVAEAWKIAREAVARWLPGECTPPMPDVVRDTIRVIGGFRLVAHMPADEQWRQFSAAYADVTRARQRGKALALPPPPARVTQIAARAADHEQDGRADVARKRTSTTRVESIASVFTRVPAAKRAAPSEPTATPAKPVETEEQRQQRVERQREKLRAQARQLGCAQPAPEHSMAERGSTR